MKRLFNKPVPRSVPAPSSSSSDAAADAPVPAPVHSYSDPLPLPLAAAAAATTNGTTAPAPASTPTPPPPTKKLFGFGGGGRPREDGGPVSLAGTPLVPPPVQLQPAPAVQHVQFYPPRIENVAGVIGYSCAAPEFDFAYLLTLSDYISRSALASKDAAKALRKELKYGTPAAQEKALRLLWLLMQNADLRFKQQVASKKFLAEYAELVTGKKTDAAVRTQALHVLSPLAYEYQLDAELSPLTALWNKLKPPEAPINGAPLPPDDPLLAPPPPTSKPHRDRDMPSEADQLRELRQLARNAKGNAQMLLEAVAFADEKDLLENQIVAEFHGKCMSDQDVIVSNLGWATVQAEKARAALPPAAAAPPADTRPAPNLMSNNPFAAPRPTPEQRTTDEEATLAALLGAHSEIIDALHLHQTRIQSAQEAQLVHAAEERSKVETRFDRRAEQEKADAAIHRAWTHDYVEGTSGTPAAPPPSRDEEEHKGKAVDRNPYHHLAASTGNGAAGSGFPQPPYSAPVPLPTLHQGAVFDEPDSFDTLLPSATAGFPPPSPSSYAPSTHDDNSNSVTLRKSTTHSDMFVPLVPSQKALGKIRRVSIRTGDGEDAARVGAQGALEDELRKKYEMQYEEEMKARRAE